MASSRLFPFTSRISSPTSRSALSAGEPEGRGGSVRCAAEMGGRRVRWGRQERGREGEDNVRRRKKGKWEGEAVLGGERRRGEGEGRQC